MKSKLISNIIMAALASSVTTATFAADEGTDDASAAAYTNGWISASNGATTGSAFDGWYFALKPTGTGDAGTFLGDSTKLGNPGLDINSNGKSFGFFGKNAKGTYCESAAYRDFSSGLTAGQTFSIDLAVNYRNGIKGLDIRGGKAGADNRPTLFTIAIASDDYAVSNATTGNGSTKWPYSAAAPIKLLLTQTTDIGGTWKLIRGTDNPITGTYTGVASGIKLFCGNTDGTDSDNLFVNHLKIAH